MRSEQLRDKLGFRGEKLGGGGGGGLNVSELKRFDFKIWQLSDIGAMNEWHKSLSLEVAKHLHITLIEVNRI